MKIGLLPGGYYCMNYTAIDSNVIILTERHSDTLCFTVTELCISDIESRIAPVQDCIGLTVDFQNASGVLASDFIWDFGDGSPESNLTNPTHTYSVADTYTVQLIARNDTFPTCTSHYELILSTLDADWNSYDTVCIGTVSNFIDSSNSQNSTINSWKWSINGDSISNLPNSSYVFDSAVLYNVELIVGSDIGCYDTLEKSIVATELPDLQSSWIADDSVCIGTVVEFVDSSISLFTSITYWKWTINSDSISNLPNSSYVFDSAGLYNVELIVGSNLGCYDTLEKSIVATELPDLQSSWIVDDSVCVGTIVEFVDSSISLFTGISYWKWTINGDSISSTPNTSYVFDSSGLYNIRLIYGSDKGCYDTITRTIILVSNPIAEFSNTPAISGNPVYFIDSSISKEPIMHWRWDFGNGNYSTDQNPQYIFSLLGQQEVIFVIENSIGCKDTISKIVEVTTSIDKNIKKESFEIFPNPNNGQFIIHSENKANQLSAFSIFNITGQKVYEKLNINDESQGNHEININQIQSGIYFIRLVTSNRESIYRSFIIK